jgi:NAD(P)-dependent dehydrogenase (short-subunit alcohol dehydrogenase family)
MELGLAGKVVLITGGASGIGAALSELLTDEGAIVAIASRMTPEVQAFVPSFAARHPILFMETELGRPDASEAVVRQTVETYGRLDVLINNAGANDCASLTAGPAAFRLSLERNLFHVFDLAHYALPHLKAARGNIVNVSSKVAETGQGGTSGYAAAKGAMNALTREWAVELAPFGIRVNTVVPAEVMTPLYADWINTQPNPQDTLKAIERAIPLGRRMTSVREVAAMIVFLASDASSHTTGEIVHVDGGYIHLDRKCTL